MINIVIVDDHELVREGLKKVLQKDHGIRVVGEARDAEQLFDVLEKNEVQLIVLDISLPGKDGLEILKDLKTRFPRVKSLILSMHPEDRFAVRTLKAGASGYLTKESAASELVTAVRKIMNGGIYTTQKATAEVVGELLRNGSRELHQNLTDREYTIFLKIAVGATPRQIAEHFSLSTNTVNTYRRRILGKMHMGTNAELIRYAIEKGLV